MDHYFKRHPKLLEKLNSFQNIIQNVFNGLSGDNKEDKYLSEQAEIYKDHEMGKEIVREFSRAIVSLFPENVIEEFQLKIYSKN